MYINPSPSDQIWLGQADAPADAADADAPADPADPAEAADAAPPPVPPECFPGGVPSPWQVKDVGPATGEQLRMGLAGDFFWALGS